MTMPPMTAQEITDIVLKAVPQSKSDTITVRITPDTIEFTVQLPLDEKTDARIKTLVERMEPYLQQKRNTRTNFKPSSSENRSQVPKAEGWDSLPWRDNPYGQYVFADEPRAKPLISMIFAAPGGKFESGEWIYSVSKSKRDGREFLNRAKKANQK